MAAAPLHCCSGLPEPRFSLALLAFWCTIIGSGSAMRIIQTPNFVSGSIGENIIFHCSVDGTDYNFFWYRQLPGKTELEVVGSLYTYSKNIEEFPEKLKDRLKAEQTKSANPPKWEMHLELLNLQASDTGFYLCAVVYRDWGVREQAHFASTGTQVLVTDPNCDSQPPPSVVLLSPLCHKKRITLVCLVQGFHYEWPLDVIWERDGEKINRLSFATEPVKQEGKCNFATASRLSVLAKEWQKGHKYSCLVNQTGEALGDSVKSSPDHEAESPSGVSEVQLTLYVGHFIFLLLGGKSLAYSVILGIYKIYRKKGL